MVATFEFILLCNRHYCYLTASGRKWDKLAVTWSEQWCLLPIFYFSSTSWIESISPALLPEFFPSLRSLHNYTASPSLAFPSSQCFPHLCFSSSLHLHLIPLLVCFLFRPVLVRLVSAHLHITPDVILPLSCIPVFSPVLMYSLCVCVCC